MLDDQYDHDIQQRIDQKTQPPSVVGQLEQRTFQLAKIQSNRLNRLVDTVSIDNRSLIIFSGDHGIADQGASFVSAGVTV